MSRFKQLRRIENAIKHKNQEELSWALDYAQMRLKLASMKRHEKHWRKMLKQIQDAAESIGMVLTLNQMHSFRFLFL